jgi:uncharacterized protein YcbK (DUF882 family)
MSTRLRLSPHFTVEEFDCHDGTRVPDAAIPALRELCQNVLEPMRAKYGCCTVLSGYRHKAYNASIGGARFSQHIYDDTPGSVATDIRFATGNPVRWARGARWRFGALRRWLRGGRGGVGCYPAQNFVHVDSGPRRDWQG